MTSVAAVRSFISKRRRRSWLDWYFAGFAAVIAGIYLADVLSGPLARLSAPASLAAAGHGATKAAAAQAVAGTGLVIGAAAGCVLIAQALGPLALSPADASWLLLSPLDRRAVVRRPAIIATAIFALAGSLLGVLALAMAGPFLRPGSNTLPGSWLALAAVAGAALLLAAVQAALLAQPGKRHRTAVRASCAIVAVIAMAGAVASDRWTAIARAATTGIGGLTTRALGTTALVALALALAAGTCAWRLLARFPASVLRTDSVRAGRTLTAVAFLNLPLLAWIAEDNHWRARLLPSKPWPRFRPAMALAWADWRRLGRRPGMLAGIAASTLAPALAGTAITGRAREAVIAVALGIGAIAAAAQGTATSRRDVTDPALRRLLGVPPAAALAARAVLPVLLSGSWLMLALTVLPAVGVLHGWGWPLVGLAAAPAPAAAALRIARTAPIDPAEQGFDTPMGTAQPWVIARLLSVMLGLAAAYPAWRAIQAGQVHGASIVDQLAVSAIVGGGYLWVAGRGVS